jgi:hypothetical protein
MAREFCPQCGNARTGSFRFCRSCGFDFDATPEGTPLPAVLTTPAIADEPLATQTSPNPLTHVAPIQPAPTQAGSNATTNVPLLGGIAWIVCAALTGYLAYQQWTFGSATSSSEMTGTATWNAVAAAVTLYFGARLIASPSRSILDWSAAWAVLSVIGGLVQIVLLDVVGDVFVLSVIAAAIAGVLSYVGRQQYPREAAGAGTPVLQGWGAVPDKPTDLEMPPVRKGRVGRAEVVVIGLTGLVVVGGIGLLLSRARVDQILANVASAVPTSPTAATVPSQGALTVALGEVVPLVDGAGDDLGSVTVLESAEPDEILGLPPDAGKRHVAFKVRYEASAPWTYTLFDWSLHDEQNRQYEPTGIAPEPALSGGTLAPGKNTEGWVSFDVPEASEVWLDLQSNDGTVIFSVPHR